MGQFTTATSHEPSPDELNERRLYTAIIIQGLEDATLAIRELKDRKHQQEKEKLRRDARKWFRIKSGITARDFEMVCGAAGFDPDFVRVQANAFIQQFDADKTSIRKIRNLFKEEVPHEQN